MAVEIICYRPKNREILALRVLQNGENCSRSVAVKLQRAGAVQVGVEGGQGGNFVDNEVYEFSNGLVFRLFDPGSGDRSECLEFMADPDSRSRPAEIFQSLPELMCSAGIDDEWAIATLRRFVWHSFSGPVFEDNLGI